MPTEEEPENPAVEREDRRDEPYATAMQRLGLKSPQGPSEPVEGSRLSACAHCGSVRFVEEPARADPDVEGAAASPTRKEWPHDY